MTDQGIKFIQNIALIFLATFPFINLSAYNSKAYINVGTKWDNNIETQYLKDILKHKKSDEIETNLVTSALGYSTYFDKYRNYFFSYTIYSDYAPLHSEHSTIDQFGEMAFAIYDTSSFSINLATTAHHYSRNFKSLQTVYYDFGLFLDMLFDINHNLSLGIALKESYYTPHIDQIEYFKGPSSGVETSVYLYPTPGKDYIKLSAAVELFMFKKDNITNELDYTLTFVSPGKHIKYSFLQETSWYLKKLRFSFDFQYSYLKWFDKHIWHNLEEDDGTPISGEINRSDHKISLSPKVSYFLTDNLSVTSTFNYNRNITNFEKRVKKLLNFDTTQYSTSMNIKYFF